MIGKIIKGIGGFYYVKTADGTVYECKARGIFRKDKIKPYVGDNVEISTDSEQRGNIEKILERKTQLIRPSVANVDILVIVAAAANPEPNLFLIDKLLVNAEINGIKPIICINKTDIESAERLSEIYKSAGYKVIEISAKNGEGKSELLPCILGKTSAFAGLSGVGKSTILNLITDENRETGSVSEKIKRGRHTTREVELFELESGGYVFDTPGFSSFEVTRVKEDELYRYFPEMANVEGECRFKGCVHINEPDCAVKNKLNAGLIAPSRYESYKQLYNILKEFKDWGENK